MAPALAAVAVFLVAVGAVVAAVAVSHHHGAASASSTSSTIATTSEPRSGSAFHPTSAVELGDMGVQPGDLGVNWADEGAQGFSVDLTDPPPDCAPFAEVFSSRDAGAVHEYLFNVHDGDYDGEILSTVVENPSQSDVAAELPAVRSHDFAACAEATAQEWLTDEHGAVTVDHIHAEPIDLVPAANVAGWRATIDYTKDADHATFGMDIFYVTARNYVAKIRVALCPCQPQPPAQLGLVPDEGQAVSAVGQRFDAAARGISPSATTVPIPPSIALTDPCQLLTTAQVHAVIGDTRPPARITVGDGAGECTWNGVSGESVAIQTGDSITQFQTRLQDTPLPLPGLGDQAAVDPEFAGKVLVRKGNTWLWVFVERTSNDRGNALNLAKALLRKL